LISEFIILGTAAAIPSVEHHNTHLALIDPPDVILVDCGGMPTVRLTQAGIDLDQISDIILTHFHPDHVGGLPLLLMNMWLMGRKKGLRIYGLHHTLERVEDLMGFYHWEDWPQFFPISFHRLPEQEGVTVLERECLVISSTPVHHIVPTIGLRFDFVRSQFSLAYSSDTEPCPALRNLAQGVDILIHEATGPLVGHSTARQAAELASQVGVKKLYLIHYPAGDDQDADLLAEAKEGFSGGIEYAQDLIRLPIPYE
jgi:ribonuclease Z